MQNQLSPNLCNKVNYFFHRDQFRYDFIIHPYKNLDIINAVTNQRLSKRDFIDYLLRFNQFYPLTFFKYKSIVALRDCDPFDNDFYTLMAIPYSVLVSSFCKWLFTLNHYFSDFISDFHKGQSVLESIYSIKFSFLDDILPFELSSSIIGVVTNDSLTKGDGFITIRNSFVNIGKDIDPISNGY